MLFRVSFLKLLLLKKSFPELSFREKFYTNGMRKRFTAVFTVQMISEVELHDTLHWLFHPIPFFPLLELQTLLVNRHFKWVRIWFSPKQCIVSVLIYTRQEFPQCQHKTVPSPTTSKKWTFSSLPHTIFFALFRVLSPPPKPLLFSFVSGKLQ